MYMFASNFLEMWYIYLWTINFILIFRIVEINIVKIQYILFTNGYRI